MRKQLYGHSGKILALAISCAVTASCSNQPPATLANLPTATLPAEPAITVPQPDIAELQRNYEAALASSMDPHTRRQIQLRLADLEMERLEQQQAQHPGTAVSYNSAVQRYEALAAAAPDDDYILYRLARARALNGETTQSLQALEDIASAAPESPFIGEVLFRRGEAAFNRRDHDAAARDFTALLQRTETDGDSPFADNARYMLGWSQLKSAHYRASTETFLDLLDRLNERAPLAQLPQGQQRLAQDSLRGLALDLSYQGGAAAIESFNPAGGSRPYQHRLYSALGDWYADKERYRESADAFLAFVEHYPQSTEAPALHLRAIETLQKARLDDEVLPAKRQYVQRYGIRSDYWEHADAEQRDRLRGWLRPWLTELAQFDHARAQALATQRSKSAREQRQLAAQSRRAFLDAAALYQQFADTFPDDSATPERVFLMAECLEQAGEYARAWQAYSDVAWQYKDNKRGPEAGYAAILMSTKMQSQSATGNTVARDLWLKRNTEASLKFAESWPGDTRALPVLLAAADQLLQQSQYVEAIAATERAALWQPQPDIKQQQQIAMIRGHSYFALEDFANAEQAYTTAWQLSADGDSLHTAAQQRLQAAIYRQAELAQQQGDNDSALEHLLRIRDSGRTEIAATAQYDAINQLIELQQWQRASAELADFRRFYPAHRLTPTLAAKAVVIFQALQLPSAAADELMRLAAGDSDPQVRRQSLFMAAETYREAGEKSKAIDAYRQYSTQWPQPAQQRLEAQYQLTQLLEEGNSERNRWLQQLAGNGDTSPRGRYLAAYGQSALAEQSYQAFAQLQLRLPLKPSLARKKQAMDTAVADYRKVLQFNIAEFTTQANFRLAEVYRQLSRDLMDSQRPRGLNALELEQYEILLEEQAYPFEEKAIELHEANIQRTSDGIYDGWIKRSFDSLARLLPARYQKQEKTLEWSDALH
ncbi:tol-pal system YbgF family protein [Microbulbifer hainanensis]|uniref:tetratricopeptide repeat protein n=1 Tax=Microbulbifer hainanensis TaxID=2735675 RepID=UPI001868F0D5|nr:tetratricopeptide repeat protein [Microbulbifer hainanensis]